MKQWLQKTIIVAVTLLTFGMISPSHDFWATLQEKNEVKQNDSLGSKQDYQIGNSTLSEDPRQHLSFNTINNEFILSAKEMAYMKFGSKIGPVISSEFDDKIFPGIQDAIETTLSTGSDLHIQPFILSERPAGGHAEKIFHIQNVDTRRDLIRFHIRTENRPKEGYYFNFHYHIAEDSFVSHYTIGDIFWSKNRPPKWLT